MRNAARTRFSASPTYRPFLLFFASAKTEEPLDAERRKERKNQRPANGQEKKAKEEL
jgi:hypothetical protein